MQRFKSILMGAITLVATLSQAQTNFTYSSGTLNLSIPDGSPVGMSQAASLAGISGYITSLNVSLNITGGFNGDLYAYLAGPAGQFSVLLNRVGLTSSDPFGYLNSGFNITLDTAGPNIHNYQSGSYTINGSGQLTGNWSADGRIITPDSTGAAFDAASTAANLSVFNSAIPNGTWTLFLADMSGGGQSTLVSWGLTIVTVPEPQTWAMLFGGAVTLALIRRRK